MAIKTERERETERERVIVQLKVISVRQYVYCKYHRAAADICFVF